MFLSRQLLLSQEVYSKISEFYDPITALLLLCNNKSSGQKKYCVEYLDGE